MIIKINTEEPKDNVPISTIICYNNSKQVISFFILCTASYFVFLFYAKNCGFRLLCKYVKKLLYNFNLQLLFTNFLQDLSLFEKSNVFFNFINYTLCISFSFTDKPYENLRKHCYFRTFQNDYILCQF